MKMFKTSMRGFRKSDVNNYIIELNKDFADIKVSYETDITDLKLKLKNAEDEIEQLKNVEVLLSDAEKENSRLKEESEAYKEKIGEISAAYNSVTAESQVKDDKINYLTNELSELQKSLDKKSELVGNLSAIMAEKDCTISEQTEKITALEEQISSEHSAYNDNEQKLITINNQLNEAKSMLKECKDIIENLTSENAELDHLLKQATAKIAAYDSERATDSEKDIITRKARKADAALTNAAVAASSDVNNAVIENAESCLKEFRQFVDKIEFTSKNAITELTDEYTLLASRAAYYCDTLDESTKKSIFEFRGKANSICKDLKK